MNENSAGQPPLPLVAILFPAHCHPSAAFLASGRQFGSKRTRLHGLVTGSRHSGSDLRDAHTSLGDEAIGRRCSTLRFFCRGRQAPRQFHDFAGCGVHSPGLRMSGKSRCARFGAVPEGTRAPCLTSPTVETVGYPLPRPMRSGDVDPRVSMSLTAWYVRRFLSRHCRTRDWPDEIA